MYFNNFAMFKLNPYHFTIIFLRNSSWFLKCSTSHISFSSLMICCLFCENKSQILLVLGTMYSAGLLANVAMLFLRIVQLSIIYTGNTFKITGDHFFKIPN